MKKLLLTAMVALAVPPALARKSVAQSPLITQAQASVRSILKDPGSAIFIRSDVFQNGRIVCGLVNAKNSYGGYTGERTFLWDAVNDKVLILEDNADRTVAEKLQIADIFSRLCKS